jgi:hypothetical protein
MDNGRWRWMFYDGDSALNNFSLDSFGNAIPLDVFGNITYTGDGSWPSSRKATLLFRKCIENEDFVSRFELRISQLCQDVLSYENTSRHYNQVKNAMSPEITTQSFRFGSPSSWNYWNRACGFADDFLYNRVETYTAEYANFIGLNEHHEEVCFLVYPNPANDILQMETQILVPLPATYRIINIMGQTISQGSINAETQQIDISMIPAGMYFITIGNATRKFVVE